MDKTSKSRQKPFVLIVLDGWGLGSPEQSNAIYVANTPNMDLLMKKYPSSRLGCSGLDVGLPEGQMGNSEVGHLNLGAGRIVYQDYTRINLAIRDGSFFNNPVLNKAIENAKNTGGALHLLGLVSDGGVHSHIEHLFALIDLAKERGIDRVFIHAVLDGRDTPPKSALSYLIELEKSIEGLDKFKVATVSGRYYAMDRDKRWERTKKAFEAIVFGEGIKESSSIQAVEKAYQRGETDEFVTPCVIGDYSGVKPGDSIIFFNFRPDRARQITRAIALKNFNEFDRKGYNAEVYFVCLTEYDATFDLPVAFPPEKLKNILADVFERNEMRQLRIAETEKYAHVTFFFNGGEEKPRKYEDRILIPSPKVATYDLKPEMSAYEVTETLIEKIYAKAYDFILVNYANPDMVGHTGDFKAAVKAIEVVDECVGKVIEAVLNVGGEAIITADHGNADRMLEDKGKDSQPHTAHTTSDVPFIFVSDQRTAVLRERGILADVAPTILYALEIEKPEEMTGTSMILEFHRKN
ncbi:MAG: 2,3-bisphosphoglycerate-independent phosphoglycerate mutase [Actinobacteria bacterium]|nr:2,3-bisphosphoglycerate-independent phosphoglycerate mutase [Actinomycetota bacterium]